MCKNRGIYGVLGTSWVLIAYNTCPPGNSNCPRNLVPKKTVQTNCPKKKINHAIRIQNFPAFCSFMTHVNTAERHTSGKTSPELRDDTLRGVLPLKARKRRLLRHHSQQLHQTPPVGLQRQKPARKRHYKVHERLTQNERRIYTDTYG